MDFPILGELSKSERPDFILSSVDKLIGIELTELKYDQEALKGTVKEMPTRDQIDVPVNEMLIVELYSK